MIQRNKFLHQQNEDWDDFEWGSNKGCVRHLIWEAWCDSWVRVINNKEHYKVFLNIIFRTKFLITIEYLVWFSKTFGMENNSWNIWIAILPVACPCQIVSNLEASILPRQQPACPRMELVGDRLAPFPPPAHCLKSIVFFSSWVKNR